MARPVILIEKDGTERRGGLTTRLALKYIVDAWETPGQEVRLVDHHPSREANKHLMSVVQKCIVKLGLDGFQFNCNNNSLLYQTAMKMSVDRITSPREYLTKDSETQDNLTEEYSGTRNRK